MTIEMTRDEASILIAALVHLENTTALRLHPQDEAIGRALVDLRPWHSALLLAWMRDGRTLRDAVTQAK